MRNPKKNGLVLETTPNEPRNEKFYKASRPRSDYLLAKMAPKSPPHLDKTCFSNPIMNTVQVSRDIWDIHSTLFIILFRWAMHMPLGLIMNNVFVIIRRMLATHCGASVSEVTDCTAATSHPSRATQTGGGCSGSAVLRLCSFCVRGNRESSVGASVALDVYTLASLGASVALDVYTLASLGASVALDVYTLASLGASVASPVFCPIICIRIKS